MSAIQVVSHSIAEGLRPDPVISPAKWAEENLIVADGPQSGRKWDPTLTPYVVDILDDLSATSPHQCVSVRKSAQTGLTETGIAWIGSIIDMTPDRAMIVFPTINAVQDFNRDKLSPTIEQTDSLRRKVMETKTRSARSSTLLSKRFPGGSLTLTGANSAADLRSKTVKFMYDDEIDEWPLDLAGQGDPMEMADARQIAYHATGDYKKLQTSTPTILGQSRIDDSFKDGDQKYFEVPCPECKEFQRLEFGGRDTDYGLKFNTTWPYEARYACRHCGVLIEHYQKRGMVLAGKWVAYNPGPGRHPSYHIDSLTSLLTTWDKLAEAFLNSKDDPQKLKTFFNLWLGLPWEARGDAPEWQRLFARRSDYPARQIPPGGIILTAAADIQADGIYYEVVAWGRDKQSWSIDAGYLEGETSAPDSVVWVKLDEIYARLYSDSYGNSWSIDRFGVDSGFNSNTVYQWCRARPKAMALKGQDGWHRAAISSSPTKVEVDLKGKKRRRGVELWHIGTWSLKAELYANLRKDGKREGAELDPPGFVHFSENVHDEQFLKQLTAEHIKDREHKGRILKEWVANGPNHYHDCRIYNMAIAVHLGVGLMSEKDWDKWEAARCRPPVPQQGNLLSAIPVMAPASTTTEQAADSQNPRHRRQSRPRSRQGRGGFVKGWDS